MANLRPRKAVVVDGSRADPNQTSMQLALFDSTGAALTAVKKQPAQADSVASTVAAVVTDFNALLLKLKNAGVLS